MSVAQQIDETVAVHDAMWNGSAAAVARSGVVCRAPWDEAQLALLKNTIAKGASDDELTLFGHICQRTGLDPFARQIYAIKRSDGDDKKMTFQTSIDGYRLIADRTGCYVGNDAPVYDTETEDQPLWARVTVYKLVAGQARPFTAMARWKEYFPAQVRQQFMWKRMPFLMLGKVCEALALRKAFPQELSGLYTHDEMDQAERVTSETVNTVTGEILRSVNEVDTWATPPPPLKEPEPPTTVQRMALKLEIKVALETHVRPLKHAGLFKAVIYHSFGCAWDVLKDQPITILEEGIGLFRHLCAQLEARGLGVLEVTDDEGTETMAPDQWIAQEVRQIAQQQAPAVAA